MMESKEQKQHTKNIIIGLFAIFISSYLLIVALKAIWEEFSKTNPALATAAIAAVATTFATIASIIITKRLENKNSIIKEHRERKIPIYEEIIKLIFRMATSGEDQSLAITEDEMLTKLKDFTENILIWGSDDVVAEWSNFRSKSISGFQNPEQILFEVENLLLAIRKDLGHSNKGLTKGKLLGVFVNDIDKYI